MVFEADDTLAFIVCKLKKWFLFQCSNGGRLRTVAKTQARQIRSSIFGRELRVCPRIDSVARQTAEFASIGEMSVKKVIVVASSLRLESTSVHSTDATSMRCFAPFYAKSSHCSMSLRPETLRMAPSAHSADAAINLMKISGVSVKLLSEAGFL
jgi:hypothetical protein